MITANAVKELREKTGAGMMDCKKALTETAGDFEAAVDWLRKKGLAAAAKKAGRAAVEGLVALAVDGNTGVVVELNSETDFVARNEQFQNLVSEAAKLALASGNVEELKESKVAGGKTLADAVVDAVATIGENINLRRMEKLTVKDGVVASYVHNQVADGMGKICTLVALESNGDKAKLAELGKQLAMHVAAARPVALTVAELDPALVQREKQILIEQAKASGKPDNIVEKMIEGRIRKYYEEVVLPEQIFVIDGENRVADIVAKFAKENSCNANIAGFARFELGEGLEREVADFAAEVAAVAGN